MKNQLLLMAICMPLLVSAQWTTTSTTVHLSTGTNKVGIGLTSAAEKLDVSGNILSSGTIRGSGLISTNGNFTSFSSTNFSFITNSTTRLTILNSNGNVGIGTTNPSELLHVNGSIRGNQSGAIRISSGNGTLDVGARSSSYGNIDTDRAAFLFNKKLIVDEGIISSYDEALTFQAAGTTAMTILTSSGNIGIGTTLSSNPNSYKLAVNGKIGAKEVQVETSSATWPDFVFMPDYKLMPLADVEQYLKLYKHLPDVPSATEIETNGHRLGEMDATLLKKIEELTLYMIELKNENESLKSRLEQLEKKN